VKDQIDQARDRVSDIWGRGTTIAQSKEVANFYSFLRYTLKRELESHLTNKIKQFYGMLEKKAEMIHPELKHELNSVIQDRLSAIEISLVEMNEKQKTMLIDYLKEYIGKFTEIKKG